MSIDYMNYRTCSWWAINHNLTTREKYRHKGIGTAMMHGVMIKCKELGVEKCYVNSYLSSKIKINKIYKGE